jgi:ferritin
MNAPQLARLFLDTIYRHHGLHHTLISDRDPKFTSTFWQIIFNSMQTELNISSSYHPLTDGLTERTHRTTEQTLRSFVHQQHHDWLKCLSLATPQFILP